MKADLHSSLSPIEPDNAAVVDPLEVIHAMITLRAQLAEIEAQIQALQPTFFAACVALKTEKIALERATITRRLTPGQWSYSDDIVEHEGLLKLLKKQFQQAHEPIGGREVTWAISCYCSRLSSR